MTECGRRKSWIFAADRAAFVAFLAALREDLSALAARHHPGTGDVSTPFHAAFTESEQDITESGQPQQQQRYKTKPSSRYGKYSSFVSILLVLFNHEIHKITRKIACKETHASSQRCFHDFFVSFCVFFVVKEFRCYRFSRRQSTSKSQSLRPLMQKLWASPRLAGHEEEDTV